LFFNRFQFFVKISSAWNAGKYDKTVALIKVAFLFDGTLRPSAVGIQTADSDEWDWDGMVDEKTIRQATINLLK
jgi:hypothetical protein